MIRNYCDLCQSECNNKNFRVPIAATFVEDSPCDLIGVEMNLCKSCRTKIYNTIKMIVSQERNRELSKLALDIKMGRE